MVAAYAATGIVCNTETTPELTLSLAKQLDDGSMRSSSGRIDRYQAFHFFKRNPQGRLLLHILDGSFIVGAVGIGVCRIQKLPHRCYMASVCGDDQCGNIIVIA